MPEELEIDMGRPSRVLISGGRETGGVRSFAEALQAGFQGLGIAAEVIPPSGLARRWRQLRNPRILKILSTTAVFAAPVSRRALCMAHGIPCAAHQGWPRTLAILASFWLANAARGVQLVAVSGYTALHLQAIFGLRVDATIRNPMRPLYFDILPLQEGRREAITYVGRLHKSKNVDKLVPALRDVLDENPGMRAWIVGDGPMRTSLECLADGDDRIEFLGALSPVQVREVLRHSRVFVSANPVEPLGIAYLEALSQGSTVVMPASGGGLEIAPGQIGGGVHLFAASMTREEIASALRKALLAKPNPVPLASYSARAVAEAYLAADARFSAKGNFQAETIA